MSTRQGPILYLASPVVPNLGFQGQLERLTRYRKSSMYLALVETFTFCIPEFVKILLLMLIAIYIFAGWCVPVFGNTKFGRRISKSANFQDLPNAIGTLWQVLRWIAVELSAALCSFLWS